MATATVDNALLRRIDGLDGDAGRREAVALGLVDALLEGDASSLAAALDGLRDARARADGDEGLVAWLDAAIAFAYWGIERVPSQPAIAQGTQAHEFLRALDGALHRGSAELGRVLAVDETQVSRTGRRLLESGFVTRRKVGRQVFWQLTPRGRRALEDAPAPKPADLDFWQEALRRGFKGAYGDEPGERRQVDPAYERIVTSALELHSSQGIRATTWTEIAEKAGVPLETVQLLFPTLDDLARSCGRHFMESLRLPPADLAPELFTGASSAKERIHRLVEAFFGAYERGADGFTAGRRERSDVPAVEESVAALETTFDAIVIEAVRPLQPDSASVASLRALTDLEVWRALRHQGATPEGAVDEASAAVERWLQARPQG